MNNREILISIVIPVHNEEESLPQLMGELDEVIRSVSYPIEVMFINDVSTDGSRAILEGFREKFPYVRPIHMPERGGQTGCYRLAFKESKGEYIIRMDGDLQDDPQDLYQFFPLVERGYDMIMGLRELRKHKRLLRFASILYDSLVVLLFDSPLHTNTSSFIGFKAKYLRDLRMVKNDHRHLPMIVMSRGASKVKEVVVVSRNRMYGASKYKNFKKIVFGIPEVIRFFIRLKMGYYR